MAHGGTYADRIQNAKWRRDLLGASKKYNQCFSSFRALGRRIAIEGLEPPTLKTKVAVAQATVLTGFPNHAIIMKVVRIPKSQPAKDGAFLYFSAPSPHTKGRTEHFLAYGPLVEKMDPSAFLELRKDCSAPLLGFMPAIELVADPSHDFAERDAAHWVGHVFTSNPFEALNPIPEAIPTFAQVTLAYLGRILAESNVMLTCAKGDVTCLISTRDIEAGEELKTGRPPVYWMGDPEYMEKVLQYILEQKKKENTLDEPTLRQMIFGDGSSPPT